jgi:hypothetical protein
VYHEQQRQEIAAFLHAQGFTRLSAMPLHREIWRNAWGVVVWWVGATLIVGQQPTGQEAVLQCPPILFRLAHSTGSALLPRLAWGLTTYTQRPALPGPPVAGCHHEGPDRHRCQTPSRLGKREKLGSRTDETAALVLASPYWAYPEDMGHGAW